MKRYNPSEIESKWQKIWEEQKTFVAKDFDKSRPKKYLAEMFPYPSGAGLHVGHVRNFTIVDVLARFYTQQGFNVLRPFGYDTFGLPAENYAIKTGRSPQDVTRENTDNFRKQAKRLGYAIDWSRELNTSDPEYYKWTQWIFARLFEKGLAYKKESAQWWCEFDKTVLANEQVEGGKCWRCGNEVQKKKMNQWYLKITQYADELLEELDSLDWPEKIKTMQRNWIGRSEGAEIDFVIARNVETKQSSNKPGSPRSARDDSIKVFTTRPDTIFGATFMVLAPEHSMVSKITTDGQKKEVQKYVEAAQKKSDIERLENKEKTGVFTGAYAINPATGEKIPIWVADYIMMGYGTGAIMAVPHDDERDREFAEKFDLPIVKTKYTDKIYGEKKVNYKMHDWLISRQRYWGCPIPVAYDKSGQAHLVPDEQLPVLLPPMDDYKPDESGRSALAKNVDWLKVEIDGEVMTRETDTLDGYACSSWYLLRYTDPHNDKEAWSKKLADFWAPVDVYIGADHAVAHLLYVRFWTKFFADEGMINFREPAKKLIYHGYINAEDGRKMSKSLGNVIDPLEIINSGYGADTLRTYELFIAPYEMDAPWSTAGVGGVYRFLARVWKLVGDYIDSPKDSDTDEITKLQHKTIKKVTQDLERLGFNTAVAALMEYVNGLNKMGANKSALVDLLKLLAPFAPHIASELLEKLGADDAWPQWDEKYLISDEMTIAVQVNGKLRGEITVATDAEQADIETAALAVENVQNFTGDKKPARIIYVPGKIVNIVI